jgi:hypothetical protein
MSKKVISIGTVTVSGGTVQESNHLARNGYSCTKPYANAFQYHKFRTASDQNRAGRLSPKYEPGRNHPGLGTSRREPSSLFPHRETRGL